MISKMLSRKISFCIITLVLLFILYLIPSNDIKSDFEDKQSLEYVYTTGSVVYLLDSKDYIARTKVSTCNCENYVDKVKDIVESLIVDGKKQSTIPNGFRSIIPNGTKILNLDINDSIVTIDFSKELLEIKPGYEEKMIEAIVYTLTNLPNVKQVIIKVEGTELKYIPNSKKNLPSKLERSFGINKKYDITSTKDILSYTIYYINKHNDNYYYVPVTKYVNSDTKDKIKVIIDELSSGPIYESNLMSFLDVNAKLLSYEHSDNELRLNFNSYLLNDIDTKDILEEVIYTISRSLGDIYDDIEIITFYVDNEEIIKSVINDIDKF